MKPQMFFLQKKLMTAKKYSLPLNSVAHYKRVIKHGNVADEHTQPPGDCN